MRYAIALILVFIMGCTTYTPQPIVVHNLKQLPGTQVTPYLWVKAYKYGSGVNGVDFTKARLHAVFVNFSPHTPTHFITVMC